MHDDYEAEAGYDDMSEQGIVGRARRGISLVIGAAVAFSIIGGASLWVYRLSARDAADIPVIRAAAVPAKTRPEDPGGAETPHKNIRSYEIAEGGDGRIDQVELAPAVERPTEEDLSIGRLSEVAQTVAETTEPLAAEPAAAETSPSGPAVVLPRPRPTELGDPGQGDTAAAAADDPAAGDGSAAQVGSGQAPAYSPKVAIRPKNLGKKLAAAVGVAGSVEAELIRRAYNSRILIQLGALPDRRQAEAAWQKIYRANGDILAGRVLVTQPTVSGGQTFYRLRAGPFDDRSEANAICQALKARSQDCLVATNQPRDG